MSWGFARLLSTIKQYGTLCANFVVHASIPLLLPPGLQYQASIQNLSPRSHAYKKHSPDEGLSATAVPCIVHIRAASDVC